MQYIIITSWYRVPHIDVPVLDAPSPTTGPFGCRMPHEGTEFEDHYAVLGMEPPAESALDPKALSRAYKKRALKWHPDKNQGNVAEASRQFDRVRKAYDVLSDPEKRRAFETEHRAKRAAAERHARLTGKRKRMKEELLVRERRAAETAAANIAAARRRQHGGAPARKRQSVADLRKAGEAQREAMDAAIHAAAARRSASASAGHGGEASAGAVRAASINTGSATTGTAGAPRSETQSPRVLSVKWKKKRAPQYTAESLRVLFTEMCGAAVDNVLVGKKGNRAVVELRVSDAGFQQMTERAGDWGLTITVRQRTDLASAEGGATSAASAANAASAGENSKHKHAPPRPAVQRAAPPPATASAIMSGNFESAEAGILARLQRQIRQ
jgi:curved DNA-binding protein CbpA